MNKIAFSVYSFSFTNQNQKGLLREESQIVIAAMRNISPFPYITLTVITVVTVTSIRAEK